jgi:uncharacterized protein (DUF433 family)
LGGNQWIGALRPIIEVRGSSVTHIEMRNDVYYVAGTKISLDSIGHSFLEGVSPERIREDFPRLTLQQIYGAISFYLDNRPEVDAYLARQEEAWQELLRTAKPPDPKWLERIARARQAV